MQANNLRIKARAGKGTGVNSLVGRVGSITAALAGYGNWKVLQSMQDPDPNTRGSVNQFRERCGTLTKASRPDRTARPIPDDYDGLCI